MSNGPFEWIKGEDIIIDLTVLDPNTGKGLTGKSAFITLIIQKASDGRYWNGTTYLPTFATATMTEVDAVNYPGLYRHTLPGFPGNIDADKYFVRTSINNPPTIQGDDYAIYISRADVTANIKLYEAEPEFIIRSE